MLAVESLLPIYKVEGVFSLSYLNNDDIVECKRLFIHYKVIYLSRIWLFKKKLYEGNQMNTNQTKFLKIP